MKLLTNLYDVEQDDVMTFDECVFLNAYLPEIAPKEKIGRISGYGWSFGYIGGLIALAICFVLFATPDSMFYSRLDNSTGEHYRVINIFIAIWFAVFSIPTFLTLNL